MKDSGSCSSQDQHTSDVQGRRMKRLTNMMFRTENNMIDFPWLVSSMLFAADSQAEMMHAYACLESKSSLIYNQPCQHAQRHRSPGLAHLGQAQLRGTIDGIESLVLFLKKTSKSFTQPRVQNAALLSFLDSVSPWATLPMALRTFTRFRHKRERLPDSARKCAAASFFLPSCVS